MFRVVRFLALSMTRKHSTLSWNRVWIVTNLRVLLSLALHHLGKLYVSANFPYLMVFTGVVDTLEGRSYYIGLLSIQAYTHQYNSILGSLTLANYIFLFLMRKYETIAFAAKVILQWYNIELVFAVSAAQSPEKGAVPRLGGNPMLPTLIDQTNACYHLP